ncbi:COX assembly mitochondrial protein homolog [Psammomys obesus]|uniref:COX assembly mitochondrial protein homolog n=1 Tax=Psammomys obesus TaxID=48139 RepID=UPI002452C7D1|nr:COX assembly mitochondrial protein homolog [Psammomys obesus]
MALDPTDQHLGHIEKDILIPRMMREKAKKRCSEQVEDFTRCCKDSGFLMVVKCRKENSALKDCLTAYYNDPAFYEEYKLEYLKEREEFRRTGVPTKKRLLPQACRQIVSQEDAYYGNHLQCKPEMMNSNNICSL